MFFGRGRNQDQPEEPAAPQPRTLEAYALMIENMLRKNGIPPEAHRTPRPDDQGPVSEYGWHFRRGSAIIEAYIIQEDGRGYFQTYAPIIHLPRGLLLPLYRYLLELNLQLTNASLGVRYDVVYVFNERNLEGLDEVEADNIVNMVAGYADKLDNELVEEFGGRLYNQV